jgi:hypothetical protein
MDMNFQWERSNEHQKTGQYNNTLFFCFSEVLPKGLDYDRWAYSIFKLV